MSPVTPTIWAAWPPEESPQMPTWLGSMQYVSAWARKNRMADFTSCKKAGNLATVEARCFTLATTKPAWAKGTSLGRLPYTSCSPQAEPWTYTTRG